MKTCYFNVVAVEYQTRSCEPRYEILFMQIYVCFHLKSIFLRSLNEEEIKFMLAVGRTMSVGEYF